MQSPAKKITIIYIIALFLIGVLTVSSQILVRNVLANQSADSRVINIAGRQRMLSQKLTKITLIICQTDNENDFIKRHKELQDIVKLWEKSHKALQFGDTSLQIPPNHNSEIIKKMFSLIEPHFLMIQKAAKQLAIYNFQTSKEEFKPNIAEIIANEPVFLRVMNEITFQYDQEANLKIEKLKTIELVLMFITLLALLLEAVLIFKPAINKIDIYFEEVQSSHTKLLQSNQKLNNTQEEMQVYIEELKATEEEIRQNIEELNATQETLIAANLIVEEKEKQIRSIFDAVPAMIYQLRMKTNRSFSFLAVSKGSELVCGLKAKILLEDSMSVIEVIHPDDIELFRQTMQESAQTLQEWKTQFRTIIKKKTIWIEGSSMPEKQEDGSTIWSGMMVNINERKEAEMEIKQLSLVASKTNSAVVITDKNGITTWVNNAFINISGYEAKEAIGNKPGKLLQGKNTNPDDVNKIRVGLATKKPFIQEILNYHKDGTPYWLSLNITPIFDENGELEQFIGVESDISDVKNQKAIIENTLQELHIKNDEIEEKNKELHTQEEEIRQNMEELVTTQEQLKLQFSELSAKNKNISDSITYAKRIQTALLPRLKEIQFVFPESFVLFRPKDVISGDFYWFANKKEANLQIIVAADCTGHGVPGAFMSMLGSSLLSNIIHDREVYEPNKILNLLHTNIEEMLNQRQEDSTNQDGMDASICVIDRNTNHIKYGGANNSMYIISKNPILFIEVGTENQVIVIEAENCILTELKADKKPVGGRIIKQDDFNYTTQKIELNQDLCIYLSSDGYIDQIGGENRKKLMSKNLRKLFIENYEKPYQEQELFFNDFFEDWISYFNHKQLDDVMLLGFKVNL